MGDWWRGDLGFANSVIYALIGPEKIGTLLDSPLGIPYHSLTYAFCFFRWNKIEALCYGVKLKRDDPNANSAEGGLCQENHKEESMNIEKTSRLIKEDVVKPALDYRYNRRIALHGAVKAGDVAKVAQLIVNNANVNARYKRERPLCLDEKYFECSV